MDRLKAGLQGIFISNVYWVNPNYVEFFSVHIRISAVADQGFPRAGDANPQGGAKIRFYQKFPENCMKLKKILSPGEGARPLRPPPPLRSATALIFTDLPIASRFQPCAVKFESYHFRYLNTLTLIGGSFRVTLVVD